MPVDPIHLLFGESFKDQPAIRRALELADIEWKRHHPTSMDLSDAHRSALAKGARHLLDNDGQAVAIDALRRGMGTGSARQSTRGMRTIGADGTVVGGACGEESWPGGRVTVYTDGTSSVEFDETPLSYGIGTAEEQARRDGRPHLGSPEMTTKRAPNDFYGNPDTFPGAGEARERAARAAANKHRDRGGYIANCEVEGDSRRYVPEEGRDPNGMYGDSRSWPSRDSWRSRFR